MYFRSFRGGGGGKDREDSAFTESESNPVAVSIIQHATENPGLPVGLARGSY